MMIISNINAISKIIHPLMGLILQQIISQNGMEVSWFQVLLVIMGLAK